MFKKTEEEMRNIKAFSKLLALVAVAISVWVGLGKMILICNNVYIGTIIMVIMLLSALATTEIARAIK